jgi:hypothetical protein
MSDGNAFKGICFCGGLPKRKDVPAELGGSGVTLAE